MVSLRHPALVGALMLVTAGCGGEETELTTGGNGGGGGAGPQPCALGEATLLDGSCQATGVPSDGCAAGFEWRDAGCYPLLPSAPCPPGSMALPGETDCREVGPCGTGTWGDIPVEADTVYVDQEFTGGGSDGSQAAPFLTIQEGIAVAPPGAIVAVAAGSYSGMVQIVAVPVRLWGRCASMVELTGTNSPSEATLELASLDEPAEVRDLAITSAGFGISLTHVSDALLDRLWVHDTFVAGVAAVDAFGPVSARLERSLVEACGQSGAISAGVELDIVDCELRDTKEVATPIASGVSFVPGAVSLAPSTGSIINSVVRGSHGAGVLVFGSQASIVASVIQDVNPLQVSQQDGEGLIVNTESSSQVRAFAQVEQSSVLRNHEAGVLVLNADLVLDAVTVSETRAQASDQTGGNGVAVHTPAGVEASSLQLRRSLVEQSLGFGVLGSDASATIEDSWIRDVLPMPSENLFGDGAAVVSYVLPTSLFMARSYVQHSTRAGVSNFSGAATLSEVALWCNAIDIDGEMTTTEFTFDGVDTSVCGCDGELETCRVISANLQPPSVQ